MSRNSATLRFTLALGTVLLVASLLWGFSLRYGLLEGYFTAFPLVPIFFLIVGVFSVHHLRKVAQGGATRLAARMSLIVVGRLMVDVAFVGVGLYLIPNSRIAFVVTVLICYTLTLLMSVRALLRPMPRG